MNVVLVSFSDFWTLLVHGLLIGLEFQIIDFEWVSASVLGLWIDINFGSWSLIGEFEVSASVLRLWIDFGSDSWALDMFRLWSWADRFPYQTFIEQIVFLTKF
ncbi:hypothetical protein RhiirA4_476247 [Rhizophagus irregularis]|uniref:Uncharacterized protein n=1 Tax=Rhizophagus irregularis TaxID=588596 RepID=A0A2I1HBA4_9GLOM|nr:hypothetical protein RhiirA4_476247 [Rhizophagus irregularis]